MTLSEYVLKKNGVPFGHPKSLQNNLKRSLGAKNFPVFWNFWNPIFSFYLGIKIFKPLRKTFSVMFSVLLTFIFCGLIHDLITTLFRGKISLFFSVWFLIMGLIVIFFKKYTYDFSHKKWITRAITNLFIISCCFLITILLNTIFKFY